MKKGGVELITDLPRDPVKGRISPFTSGAGVFGEVELIDGTPGQHSARAAMDTPGGGLGAVVMS